MRARLYANENFPAQVVARLRGLGHDVLTVQETGKADQRFPDVAVLKFAVGQQRAVITMNRKHFIRLHREFPDHFGIIICTFDPDFERQSLRVHFEIDAAVSISGLLLRINRPDR